MALRLDLATKLIYGKTKHFYNMKHWHILTNKGHSCSKRKLWIHKVLSFVIHLSVVIYLILQHETFTSLNIHVCECFMPKKLSGFQVVTSGLSVLE